MARLATIVPVVWQTNDKQVYGIFVIKRGGAIFTRFGRSCSILGGAKMGSENGGEGMRRGELAGQAGLSPGKYNLLPGSLALLVST